MSILVYHGSTEIIEHPICQFGRKNLDFGQGFYITELRKQAEMWAKRMSARRDRSPLVNIYSLNKGQILKEFRCKIFTTYDSEWLNFIVNCRNGYDVAQDYDFIEGGIADDRVIDSINLYLQGYLSEEDTLIRLAKHLPNNQICLINQEIITKYLSYERTEELR